MVIRPVFALRCLGSEMHLEKREYRKCVESADRQENIEQCPHSDANMKLSFICNVDHSEKLCLTCSHIHNHIANVHTCTDTIKSSNYDFSNRIKSRSTFQCR